MYYGNILEKARSIKKQATKKTNETMKMLQLPETQRTQVMLFFMQNPNATYQQYAQHAQQSQALTVVQPQAMVPAGPTKEQQKQQRELQKQQQKQQRELQKQQEQHQRELQKQQEQQQKQQEKHQRELQKQQQRYFMEMQKQQKGMLKQDKKHLKEVHKKTDIMRNITALIRQLERTPQVPPNSEKFFQSIIEDNTTPESKMRKDSLAQKMALYSKLTNDISTETIDYQQKLKTLADDWGEDLLMTKRERSKELHPFLAELLEIMEINSPDWYF